MLPKSERLTAEEVRAVLANGRVVRAGSVSARVMAAKQSKAAVVVSKRVAKTAALRNRLRRLGYRVLDPLPHGVHLVLFIHKPDVALADIQALCLKLS